MPLNEIQKKVTALKSLGPKMDIYDRSLFYPELMLKTRIPRQFGTPSLPFSRHFVIPATVNVLSNCFFAFQPYWLSDNTATFTTLYLNNNATYDGNTTLGLNQGALLTMPFNLPAGNVQSFSLVSASMIIQPQGNWTTITGICGLGNMLLPLQVGVAGGAPAGYNSLPLQTFSNINEVPNFLEVNLQQSQSARILYTAADIKDFDKYAINGAEPANELEQTFIGYITGAPASMKFNIEIYLNFEVTATTTSAFIGMAETTKSMHDPQLMHHFITNNNLVTSVVPGFRKGVQA